MLTFQQQIQLAKSLEWWTLPVNKLITIYVEVVNFTDAYIYEPIKGGKQLIVGSDGIDTYTVEMRNVKENGAWVQKPHYVVQDKLPYGHGEKSVYIANGFIRLTREEAMCINWHMGEYDMRAKAGVSLSEIYYKYPLVLLFHLADNMATYLDETV